MKRLFFVLFACAIMVAHVDAKQTFSAKCGEMKGTVLTQEGTLVPSNKSGEVLFFVDSGQPSVLVSYWPAIFGDKGGKPERHESVVIQSSSERLTAMDQDAFGLFTYTFDLESKVLLLASERFVSLTSGKPDILALVSQCVITH